MGMGAYKGVSLMLVLVYRCTMGVGTCIQVYHGPGYLYRFTIGVGACIQVCHGRCGACFKVHHGCLSLSVP